MTPVRDLPHERRHDTAPASENVPEPHTHISTLSSRAAIMDDVLDDALRGTHAPMTLEGRTALSVEIRAKCSTLYRAQSVTTFSVPSTSFITASATFASISGTCLCAAT